MDKLSKFIAENDPVAKIEILINTFSLDDIRDRFGITELTEEFIECLDVFTAYDFIEFYEDYIVDVWKKM